VSAPLVEQAPAKINLTLRVLGRRKDGYHELESLVVFADLADTLTLEPGATATLDVAGPFAAASGKVADNLVLKALAALRQCVDGLSAGHFQLEKRIPVAAGIGGGSADAAAALRLLARLNGIALDDGSDQGGRFWRKFSCTDLARNGGIGAQRVDIVAILVARRDHQHAGERHVGMSALIDLVGRK